MEPIVRIASFCAIGIIAWSVITYVVFRALLARFVGQIDSKLEDVSAGLRQGDKDRQRLELQITALRGEFVSKRDCNGCQSKIEAKLDRLDEKFDKILLQQGGA